jgi:hypothetical protein
MKKKQYLSEIKIPFGFNYTINKGKINKDENCSNKMDVNLLFLLLYIHRICY